MNKKCFVLLLLVAAGISLFAESSRFYEGGRLIDTMYVTSPEGLRIRDDYSLKAGQIGRLDYRMPVKVVAVTGDVTIDGVTDPWVEILLPFDMWKNDAVPEYGWVFGGYLSSVVPEFRAPSGKADLEYYLQSAIIKFQEDIFYDSMYMGASYFFQKNGKVTGIWWNDATQKYSYFFSGSYTVYDDHLYITSLGGYMGCYLYLNSCSSTEFTGVVRAHTSRTIHGSRTLYFDEVNETLLRQYLYSYLDSRYEFETFISHFDGPFGEDAIRYGVDCSREPALYERYRTYWDPIMKAHQDEVTARESFAAGLSFERALVGDNRVNVRNAPGTAGSSVLYQLNAGDEIKIYDTIGDRMVSNGVLNLWYRISPDKEEYINGEYVYTFPMFISKSDLCTPDGGGVEITDFKKQNGKIRFYVKSIYTPYKVIEDWVIEDCFTWIDTPNKNVEQFMSYFTEKYTTEYFIEHFDSFTQAGAKNRYVGAVDGVTCSFAALPAEPTSLDYFFLDRVDLNDKDCRYPYGIYMGMTESELYQRMGDPDWYEWSDDYQYRYVRYVRGFVTATFTLKNKEVINVNIYTGI